MMHPTLIDSYSYGHFVIYVGNMCQSNLDPLQANTSYPCILFFCGSSDAVDSRHSPLTLFLHCTVRRIQYSSLPSSVSTPSLAPLAMATCRAQYNSHFKRCVVLMAEEIGNSAAARRLDVNESTIRGWLLQREPLARANPAEKVSVVLSTAATPSWKSVLFLIEQHNRLMAVSVELIQFKASGLAQQMGIPQAMFKATQVGV